MNEKNAKRREGLKTLRKQAELTQARFAFAVGATEKTVRDWENGGAIPAFDKAIAMAKVLNVSLKRLAQELELDVSDVPDDC
ncbi:MAG: helix-turn-helix domain-containing protein [Pegethrix bostrychoides GSE-TBD4-15B]|jgi:transcriptional regulator with XRE-family HTH domain|uniref:Helix-turn-helix domain-containing protein n=1 Tax=Pegethrix bostrychoides GSE-TBD4-15B TaxID=2839662 RepID=A0A951PE75_9CYAN|nr:helix-turn-helix domain-containing protein [Pegethrix bostrychoides GSE-TBD4-15B]